MLAGYGLLQFSKFIYKKILLIFLENVNEIC